MAKCEVCGKPAGLMMTMCQQCITETEAAAREARLHPQEVARVEPPAPIPDVPRPLCPQCGSDAVQGQMISSGDALGGLLTALMTNDMAASVMVAKGGPLIVKAFCLFCGASWLPAQDFLARAAGGEFGPAWRRVALGELDKMIERGSGLIVANAEVQRMGEWAKAIRAAALKSAALPAS